MKKLLVLLLLAACEPVDIFVADVHDGGGFDPRRGPPCAGASECRAGQFCEKPTCGATLGRCMQRPAACPGEGPPQCGCDGVTYWNECLRRRAGVEANLEPGECSNPVACDQCPGAYCAKRVYSPTECSGTVAGACFVLPEVACVGPGPSFTPCGGPMQCLDHCAAIRSEQPMLILPRGVVCP